MLIALDETLSIRKSSITKIALGKTNPFGGAFFDSVHVRADRKTHRVWTAEDAVLELLRHFGSHLLGADVVNVNGVQYEVPALHLGYVSYSIQTFIPTNFSGMFSGETVKDFISRRIAEQSELIRLVSADVVSARLNYLKDKPESLQELWRSEVLMDEDAENHRTFEFVERESAGK